jgi:hypothetical protein
MSGVHLSCYHLDCISFFFLLLTSLNGVSGQNGLVRLDSNTVWTGPDVLKDISSKSD